MTRFVYSVLRFVPDPARGEFVNVGAIVGDPEAGQWELHEIENKRRARALAGSTATISTFTDHVGRLLDAWGDDDDDQIPFLAEDWLEDLARGQRNVVQLTPPAPVSADTLEDALGFIRARMLIDPVSGHLPYTTRTTARSRLRAAYKAAGLTFQENVFGSVLLAVNDSVAEHLDFAVANGKPLQLSHAWSFQTPDDEALVRRFRSWSWTIKKLRDAGGVVRLGDNRRERIDPTILLEAAVVPPQKEIGSERVWDEAQGTFEELSVAVIPYEDSGVIAREAAQLLAQSA